MEKSEVLFIGPGDWLKTYLIGTQSGVLNRF
jgi:hypothetical protein